MDWPGEKIQRTIPNRVLSEYDFALRVGADKHRIGWSSDRSRWYYWRHLLIHLFCTLFSRRTKDDGQTHWSAIFVRISQLEDKDLKDAKNTPDVRR